MTDIKAILAESVNMGASDIHINVGMPPVFRKNTDLVTLDAPPITGEQARDMVISMIGKDRFREFEQKKDLDFAATLDGG